MGDYRRLSVWQAAHVLALAVYRCSSAWPRAEQFGLGDQVRRAAVSIGANIAEGCERDSTPDFIKFLRYSKGSCGEL